MEESFGSRLKHAWNAFFNRDPTNSYRYNYSYRPDRKKYSNGKERTIIASIYNRLALDASSIDILHVKTDDEGRYNEIINSGLNKCLNFEANLDQTGRSFKQDIIESLLDEGVIAIVPTDTTLDPKITKSYDILKLRTGKILEWYPDKIKVRIYDENSGKKKEIILPKSMVAIVENPFYSVMNEYNSTLQRLIRKLNLLDVIDEQQGSTKLNMIIQLPYLVKNQTRKKQAENRRNEIEDQLVNSKYGIAYSDGTEKIIQLNRSLDNNLMNQIEYLTKMLFSQLGLTEEILNGTASDSVMTNYFSRTIEPIMNEIVSEMKRKFLSKTAISQKQSIMYFRDPFKLISVEKFAELADKLTRNEIMTSNEIRQKIGLKPSSDPKADQLINSNISQPNNSVDLNENTYMEGEIQNG